VDVDSLSLISIGGFFFDLLGLGILYRSFGISGSGSGGSFGVPIRASLIS